MACASRSVISIAANSCSNSSFSFKSHHLRSKIGRFDISKSRIRATSDESEDCNVEECAPDKEVGKISVEWLAGEKTKVVGTFPPRKRGWTGYVEKDTAGQTNIYSVEPAVYVAESVISSGSAGSSSDGSQNTAGVAAFVALISVAAASSILLQVSKNPPSQIRTAEYSGPSLSYYISKFTPPETIQASVPSRSESPSATETQDPSPKVPQVPAETANELDLSLEVPQVPVETANELLPSTFDVDNAS